MKRGNDACDVTISQLLTRFVFILLCGVSRLGTAEITSNELLELRLRNLKSSALQIEFIEIGRSALELPIHAVHLRSLNHRVDQGCVALLIGQQHGNEPAGAEALLELVTRYAREPETFEASLDLWVVPRVNPDGAALRQRVNGNQADLNRDHLVLLQPETQAIHRLVQRISPHLVVDCHEFARDSEDYRRRGLIKWPTIMMDSGNLPVMPEEMFQFGVATCDQAGEFLAAQSINYTRYTVGDFPTPAATGELRHSTLDADDARNGLSLYGSISFIIESGQRRYAPEPDKDLGERVRAYSALFHFLLHDHDRLLRYRDLAERSRTTAAPAFLATNVFWGSTELHAVPIKVFGLQSEATRTLLTSTLMRTRVIKSVVPIPARYLVSHESSQLYGQLLQRHGIPYELFDSPCNLVVEACDLQRVEDDNDPVYHRYAGRQIVSPRAATAISFPVGTLSVELSNLSPMQARRAAVVLEPRSLYGLYQWEVFHSPLKQGQPLPVYRELNADSL